MNNRVHAPAVGLLQRFLSRLRFPQLFVVAGLLFVADLFFPDVIPLVDEILLFALTTMAALWKDRRPVPDSDRKPPPKHVTPEGPRPPVD